MAGTRTVIQSKMVIEKEDVNYVEHFERYRTRNTKNCWKWKELNQKDIIKVSHYEIGVQRLATEIVLEESNINA